ncbi:MAG: hypothetical protein ACOYLB_06745 [Phototrophicaceae bacterium]
MFKHLPILILVILSTVLIHSVVLSQSALDTCPAIALQALDSVAQNCEQMPRNSACYAYNNVSVTFLPNQFAKFTDPSDIVDVAMLSNLQTQPLDPLSQAWGVAVMKLQAILPNTLPGQAVTFLVFGDASIEDASSGADVFVPIDPIQVIATLDLELRAQPNANAPIITLIPVGTLLAADAISEDQQFVRIIHNDAFGWVNISGVLAIAPSSLTMLPTLTSRSRAPMQSFSFTTSIGNPQCQETPDMIVVQGPKDVTIDMTINGVDVTVSSTITLWNTDGQDGKLVDHIGVLEGMVEDQEGNALNQGEKTTLGDTTRLNTLDLRMLGDNELNKVNVLEGVWDVAPEVLNYPVTVGDATQFLNEAQQQLSLQNSTSEFFFDPTANFGFRYPSGWLVNLGENSFSTTNGLVTVEFLSPTLAESMIGFMGSNVNAGDIFRNLTQFAGYTVQTTETTLAQRPIIGDRQLDGDTKTFFALITLRDNRRTFVRYSGATTPFYNHVDVLHDIVESMGAFTGLDGAPLVLFPSSGDTPVATPETAQPTTNEACQIVVVGDVEMRVGPGTNRSVIGYVPIRNQALDVMGRASDNAGNSWFQLNKAQLGSGVALVNEVWVLETAPNFNTSGNCTLLEAIATPRVITAPRAAPTAQPVPTTSNAPITTAPVAPTAQTAYAIIDFQVDRDSIPYGECATLSWNVENIDKVFYQNNPTVGQGSSQECPTSTTTYRLSVLLRDGTSQDRYLTVSVGSPQTQPIISPTAPTTP